MRIKLLLAGCCLLSATAMSAGITLTSPPVPADSCHGANLQQQQVPARHFSMPALQPKDITSGADNNRSSVFDGSVTQQLTVHIGNLFYTVDQGGGEAISVNHGEAKNLETWGEHSFGARKSEAPLGVKFTTSTTRNSGQSKAREVTITYTFKNKTREDMNVDFGILRSSLQLGQDHKSHIAPVVDGYGAVTGLRVKDGSDAVNSFQVRYMADDASVAAPTFYFGDMYEKSDETKYTLVFGSYENPGAILDPSAHQTENWMKEDADPAIEPCLMLVWKDVTVPAKSKIELSYKIVVDYDESAPLALDNDFRLTSRDVANWNDMTKAHPVTISGTFSHPEGKVGRVEANYSGGSIPDRKWEPLTDNLESGTEFSTDVVIPARGNFRYQSTYPVHYRIVDEDGDIYDLVPTEIPTAYAVTRAAVWSEYGRRDDGSWGYTYYSPVYDGTQHTFTEFPQNSFTPEQYRLTGFGENVMPGYSAGTYDIEGVYPHTIGSAIGSFPIRGLELPGDIELEQSDYEYEEGMSVTPKWHFTDPDAVALLKEGEDYNMDVPTATERGAYSVTMRGNGCYANSNTPRATFFVRSDLPEGAFVVEGIPEGTIPANQYERKFFNLRGVDLEDAGLEDFSDAFDNCNFQTEIFSPTGESLGFSYGNSTSIREPGTYVVSLQLFNLSWEGFWCPEGYRLPGDGDFFEVGRFTVVDPDAVKLPDEEWETVKRIRDDLLNEKRGWADPWPADATSEELWRFKGLQLTEKTPDSDFVHVQGVNLAGQGISGAFPATILELPYLDKLVLNGNKFSGRLEDIFAQGTLSPACAPRLTFLNLARNSFEGDLGALTSLLPRLVNVDASGNSFTEMTAAYNGMWINMAGQRLPGYYAADISEILDGSLQEYIPDIVTYPHGNKDKVTITVNYDRDGGKFYVGQGILTAPEGGCEYSRPSGDVAKVMMEDIITDKSDYNVSAVLDLILTWTPGDADMDGALRIADVQFTIRYILDGVPARKPVNIAAADMYADNTDDGTRIVNVQDVVVMVDRLLNEPASPDGRSANGEACDGTVSIEGRDIVLRSRRDIAALLLRTSKGAEWALASNGLASAATPDRRNAAAYSIDGSVLKAGRTVIGHVDDPSTLILEVQAADIEGNPVPTDIADASTTSVTLPEADGSAMRVYDLLGRPLKSDAKGLRIVVDKEGNVTKKF